MLNFVQHGSDGFGHQLHGLFSSLILTDIRNYNFDAYSFIKKKFYFQHLSKKEEKQVQDYMIQVVNLFRNLYNPKKLPNNFFIGSRIISNIAFPKKEINKAKDKVLNQ